LNSWTEPFNLEKAEENRFTFRSEVSGTEVTVLFFDDYREAAEAFLAQSGRTCRITDGYLVVAPSWEFAYVCDPGQAVSSSPPKQ